MAYYSNIIDETLRSLASHRSKKKVWGDNEQGEGTLKTCEAMESFFSPYIIDPSNLKPNTLDNKLIIDDITQMNDNINKHGYVPHPYLNINENFTDCVAFVLRLFVHVNKYFEDNDVNVDENLKEIINTNINKCVDWLIDGSLCDKSTCCWDAVKIQKEQENKSFGNVYFTYSAMIALYHSISYFELNSNKRKNIENRLTKSGTWLSDRYNEDIGRFFGGVVPVDSNIIYTPYAIFAIIATWNYQTPKARGVVKKSISELINTYRNDPIEFSQRAYYRFPYKMGKKLQLYEDRSTIATTLTALSLAADTDLGLDITDSTYYRLLNSIAEELVSYRDEDTKRWNKRNDFLIYYNQRATEALASFVKYGKVTEIQLNEYEMRVAIKEGLMREEVTRAIMDSIQKQVNKKVLTEFKR